MNTFTIIGFHQNGRMVSQEKTNNVRIVCNTQEGKIVAVWGTESENYHNTNNIEMIEFAQRTKGFPFVINCEVNPESPPADFQKNYGHGYWINENNHLEIV
jgi:hypothetical protein